MKRHLICIPAFFLFACSATQTSTPTVYAIRIPSPTPTVFSTPKLTSIPPTLTPTTEEQNPDQTEIPVSAPTIIIPTLQVGRSIQLSSVKMIDSQIGWAIYFESENILRPGFTGDPYLRVPEGYILRTTDGGKTWQFVMPLTGAYSADGFFALDANTAWASDNIPCCNNFNTTQVWRTTDGGRTWQTSQPFMIDIGYVEFFLPVRMQFIDQNMGWLLANTEMGMASLGSSLFRTTDGGKTWENVNGFYRDLGGCWSVGFAFINMTAGWYGSNCFSQGVIYEHLETFYSTDQWRLSMSKDGGETFSPEPLLPIPDELKQPELAKLNSECDETKIVSFSKDVVGVEWGCHIFDNGMDFRYFDVTSDAGKTWTWWKTTGNEYFLDGLHGWRLLSPGQLQETKDSGSNWITIKTVAWDNAQFDFINEQEGWAIVSNADASALVYTADGGKSWTEFNPVIAP